jgi:hypothetical protein
LAGTIGFTVDDLGSGNLYAPVAPERTGRSWLAQILPTE